MLTMIESVDVKIWVRESGRMESNYDEFERCPCASCGSLWGLVLQMCGMMMMMLMMMMMMMMMMMATIATTIFIHHHHQ